MQPLTVNNHIYYPVPRGHARLVNKDIRLYYVKGVTASGQAEDVLYIHNKDYESYLSQLLKNKEHSSESKLSLTSEALLFSFAYQGVTSKNLEVLSDLSFEISEMHFENTKALFNLLINSPALAPGMFRAVISRFIAHKEGWTNSAVLNKLITAALFCDLGSVAAPSRPHFDASSDMLELAGMAPETVQAVRQHHEYLDGSGPYRLKKFNIHPFAKIIRVSDEIYPYFQANQLLAGINKIKAMAPDKLDQKFVQALTTLSKK